MTLFGLNYTAKFVEPHASQIEKTNNRGTR